VSIKVIVSKTAHLTAILYNIYYAPFFRSYPLYSLFYGPMSKLLYIGSVINENNLWRDLFEAVISRSRSSDINDIIGELDSIEVYKWVLLEDFLKKQGAELTNLYANMSDRINDLLVKVLGNGKQFKEIYVLLAYNPGWGSYGSMTLYDPGGEYVVTIVFTRRNLDTRHVLDVLIHELIHGLLRLNNIELSEEEEEELIDTLCPEGYLSHELGLSTVVRTSRSRFASTVSKYFENKMFNTVSLIEYLRLNGQLRSPHS